jgi:hypothetical protein
MDTSSLQERNRLLRLPLRPQKGADFLEETAEACGCVEDFQSVRGPTPLFYAPMVLLQTVIQVAIGPMYHMISKNIPNGPRIGVMLIGGDSGLASL